MSCEEEYLVFGINNEVFDVIWKIILQWNKVLFPVVKIE